MELKEVITKWTAERDGCTVEVEVKGHFHFVVRSDNPYLFVCGHCASKEAALSTCNAIIDHWISL